MERSNWMVPSTITYRLEIIPVFCFEYVNNVQAYRCDLLTGVWRQCGNSSVKAKYKLLKKLRKIDEMYVLLSVLGLRELRSIVYEYLRDTC